MAGLITNALRIKRGPEPSTPPADEIRLWVDQSSGTVKQKDSTGLIKDLTGVTTLAADELVTVRQVVPGAGGQTCGDMSPFNSSELIGGTDTGGIQFTFDGGRSWVTRQKGIIYEQGRKIADVIASETVRGKFYAAVGNGQSGNGGLYYTLDWGLSGWTRMDGDGLTEIIFNGGNNTGTKLPSEAWPRSTGNLLDVDEANGIIYCGSYANGVYKVDFNTTTHAATTITQFTGTSGLHIRAIRLLKTHQRTDEIATLYIAPYDLTAPLKLMRSVNANTASPSASSLTNASAPSNCDALEYIYAFGSSVRCLIAANKTTGSSGVYFSSNPHSGQNNANVAFVQSTLGSIPEAGVSWMSLKGYRAQDGTRVIYAGSFGAVEDGTSGRRRSVKRGIIPSGLAATATNVVWVNVGVDDNTVREQNYGSGQQYWRSDETNLLGLGTFCCPDIIIDRQSPSKVFLVGRGTWWVTEDAMAPVYPALRTIIATTTNANATITSATGAFDARDIGAAIAGPNIPANATITAVASETSATISANASGAGTNVAMSIIPRNPISQAIWYPSVTGKGSIHSGKLACDPVNPGRLAGVSTDHSGIIAEGGQRDDPFKFLSFRPAGTIKSGRYVHIRPSGVGQGTVTVCGGNASTGSAGGSPNHADSQVHSALDPLRMPWTDQLLDSSDGVSSLAMQPIGCLSGHDGANEFFIAVLQNGYGLWRKQVTGTWTGYDNTGASRVVTANTWARMGPVSTTLGTRLNEPYSTNVNLNTTPDGDSGRNREPNAPTICTNDMQHIYVVDRKLGEVWKFSDYGRSEGVRVFDKGGEILSPTGQSAGFVAMDPNGTRLWISSDDGLWFIDNANAITTNQTGQSAATRVAFGAGTPHAGEFCGPFVVFDDGALGVTVLGVSGTGTPVEREAKFLVISNPTVPASFESVDISTIDYKLHALFPVDCNITADERKIYVNCYGAGVLEIDLAAKLVPSTSTGSTPTPEPEALTWALGDEDDAVVAGPTQITFRMAFAFNLTEVRSSLKTASSSGTPTVDINEAGVSILSTKLTIDVGEKTSKTAAIPPVLSDTFLPDDSEVTIDVDVAGTGATGLKVTLIGTRAT